MILRLEAHASYSIDTSCVELVFWTKVCLSLQFTLVVALGGWDILTHFLSLLSHADETHDMDGLEIVDLVLKTVDHHRLLLELRLSLQEK